MNRIKKVVPKERHCLEVFLENGCIITLNLEDRLQTLRFGALANEEFFKRVATDGVCIRWEEKVEISLNEVFQLAQKGLSNTN